MRSSNQHPGLVRCGCWRHKTRSLLSAVVHRRRVPGYAPRDAGDHAGLVALYGQLCSRLGRLLRDRLQVESAPDDELQQAINDALDIAGEVLGLDL